MRAIPTGLNHVSGANRPEAAVSIIRCSHPVDSILLLRRKKTRSDPWSGHFAFPGGKRDLEDDSIFATCLRETREETAISLDGSLLSRQLPVTLAGRNVEAPIQVQPFIFTLVRRPAVIVETSEIDSYLWLDVDKFTDKNRHVTEEALPSRFYPVYPLEDYFIWGFTYGLLCSILKVNIGW
jgi:8-oxo-dGTP diphosphatase